MNHPSSIAKSYNAVSVRLPADLQLDQADLSRISAVHPDSFDCGTHVVDFFDRRDAARYEARAAQMFIEMAQHTHMGTFVDPMPSEELLFPPGLEQPKEVLLPPGLEQIPTPCRFAPAPTKTKKQALQPKGHDIQIKGHEVQIKGLPPNLLTNVMISAIMEQAGLDTTVISIDTKTYARQGVASITFASECAAGACVEHCNGRKWNPMGPPVVAHIISQDSAKSSRRMRQIFRKREDKACAMAPMNTQQSTNVVPSWLRSDQPAYVHSSLTGYGLEDKWTANSDVSTTVSDSDVDDERRHACKTIAWLENKTS